MNHRANGLNCLVGLAALLTTSVLAAPTALAAGSSQVKQRQSQERAARKACLTGDYAKGVSILSDLFLDTRNPTYLFNQGRCFEQNRRYDDAIARFEEYLRAADNPQVDQADKSAAEKHIADCKESLARETGRTSPVQPPPQPVEPTPPPAPVAAPPPVVIVQQAPPTQPAPSTGAGLRTAGIVTASVGLAAVVAGVIFNVKANGMASDMENTPGGYSSSKESDRKTYETMGWVGYGAGAACVATGAILYFVGRSRGHAAGAASLEVAPMIANGQAGALLKGSF
jgi:hypothetical protein